MFDWWRRLNRAEVLGEPFPPEFREHVVRRVPCAELLSRYAVWSKVAGDEYRALVDAAEQHRRTSIDAYGATNPPEFFAVVVEQFFEKPLLLARRHGALYAELAAFFRFDPAARRQKLAET